MFVGCTMQRDRPATSNKPTQTLLPGLTVEETFRVAPELDLSLIHI